MASTSPAMATDTSALHKSAVRVSTLSAASTPGPSSPDTARESLLASAHESPGSPTLSQHQPPTDTHTSASPHPPSRSPSPLASDMDSATLDIFDTALSSLFAIPPIAFSTASPSEPHTYTPPSNALGPTSQPIRLWLPNPPADVYAALQANNLWLSAVFLADRIATGTLPGFSPTLPSPAQASVDDIPTPDPEPTQERVPTSVAELGAGAGLPGIVACLAGARVVSTDYDDPTVIAAIRRNFTAALGSRDEQAAADTAPGTTRPSTGDADTPPQPQPHSRTQSHPSHPRWTALGHSWGTPPTPVLAHSPTGFDVLLLADTLWTSSWHPALLDSVCALLRPGGTAHVAAGLHTGRGPVARFIALAESRGLRAHPREEVRWAQGEWEVYEGGEGEGEERGVVVYFTLHRDV